MYIEKLLEERKKWYLNNEFKEYNKEELPQYIQLRLDTKLRQDKVVLEWTIDKYFPVFSKEELGEVYHIGFNHGLEISGFKKEEIVNIYCKSHEAVKNINWE
jgi:hypothetical protein